MGQDFLEQGAGQDRSAGGGTLVFIWGSKGRVQADAVTRDSDYTCAKCTYQGRLLLYSREKRSHVYFVPVGGWHSDGGAFVCPACGYSYQLTRRKYRQVEKIDSGPELVTARMEIEIGFMELVTPANQIASESSVAIESGPLVDEAEVEVDQAATPAAARAVATPHSAATAAPGWWQANDGQWYPPSDPPGPAANPLSVEELVDQIETLLPTPAGLVVIADPLSERPRRLEVQAADGRLYDPYRSQLVDLLFEALQVDGYLACDVDDNGEPGLMVWRVGGTDVEPLDVDEAEAVLGIHLALVPTVGLRTHVVDAIDITGLP